MHLICSSWDFRQRSSEVKLTFLLFWNFDSDRYRLIGAITSGIFVEVTETYGAPMRTKLGSNTSCSNFLLFFLFFCFSVFPF